jgi:hypothetical protein
MVVGRISRVAANGQGLPMIALLYTVAIVGFTAAGLGLLSVRPLDRVVLPAGLQ